MNVTLVAREISPVWPLTSRCHSVLKLWPALLLLEGCCSEADHPCLPWVKVGTTYNVELGAHFEAGNLGANGIQPYSNYHDQEISCGSAVDIWTGDVLSVRAARKNGAENDCGGCYYVWADVPSVPNIELGRDLHDVGFFPGMPDFAAQRSVDLGGGCTGIWTFGVEEVLEPFKQQQGDPNLPDAMAFRSFWSTVDPATCTMLPAAVLTAGRCWDSWFIRVTDQAGNVVVD